MKRNSSGFHRVTSVWIFQDHMTFNLIKPNQTTLDLKLSHMVKESNHDASNIKNNRGEIPVKCKRIPFQYLIRFLKEVKISPNKNLEYDLD